MSNFSLVPTHYMDSNKSPFLRKGGVSHHQSDCVLDIYVLSTSCVSHIKAGALLCVPVRCDRRLEKPLQFRAAGKILIGHEEGAGK